MNYGRAIRVARAARNWTQRQLAEAAGLDASYVSLVEAEKRTPSLKALQRLADALAVPPHLMALLAAEKGELRGISTDQASHLGKSLLELVLSFAGGDASGIRKHSQA